jgi:hypothetical protein
MAHFAQIDNTNIVLQVIVVNNEVINNAEGLDGEATGIAFCQSLYGAETKWLQTSYNGSFRKNFAGIGYTYDETRDAFIPPKPAEGNWIFSEEIYRWEPDTSL